MALTRQAFLAANDIRRELVTVPNIGDVFVRGMSAAEHEDYLHEVYQRRESSDLFDHRGLKVWQIVRCVVDEQGAPLFTASDAQALLAKSKVAIDTLASAIARLSGTDDKEAEGLEKN
ncbi:MAG: hypothetical protein L0Z53_19265 [Acidobacteriales bacterium]|nr:hypothetical protein [Terriglobales bacterium]